MTNALRRTVAYIREFAHQRPYETSWSLLGLFTGALIGLALGGIGIAALGGARGFPGFLLCALALGFVGNRIGVEHDRKVLADKMKDRGQ